MEKTLLLLAAVTLLGSLYLLNSNETNVSGVPEDVQIQFSQFKLKFNKKYGSEEDSYRLNVFNMNINRINEFNTYKGENQMGITLFADLTQQEFAETYLTTLSPEVPTLVAPLSATLAAASVDWRDSKVTPVKNQGQCGSCWAFSTTGVLEGFLAKNGVVPSLSEQQLVDCAGILYGNLGCNGGMPSRALNYVKAKGSTTEAAYPYKAVKGSCTVSKGEYTISGHAAVTASDEGIIAALQNGPVSVAVDATNWSAYVQGIFSDCDAQMNHAVLAVGYTADYYIIKNSWTTAWGEDGYMQLKRGNTCGVLNTMVVAN